MTASQPKLNTSAAREIIGSDDATATALHSILLTVYGDNLYGDEAPDPLEIYADLEDRFNVTVGEDNQNRIQAILMAVGSDEFYTNETAFVAVAESLLDGDLGDVPTGEMNGLSILELLWGIYEVAVNRDENVPPFAPRIQQLIREISENEAQDDGDDIPGDLHDVEFLREKRGQVLEQLHALWGDYPFEADIPDPIDILRPVT